MYEKKKADTLSSTLISSSLNVALIFSVLTIFPLAFTSFNFSSYDITLAFPPASTSNETTNNASAIAPVNQPPLDNVGSPVVNQSPEENPHEKLIEIPPYSYFDPTITPYNPLRANVTPGTEVTWLNQDSVPHQLISGDPERGPTSQFHSGPINSGKNFTQIFTKAGVYEYYDPTYRHMKGQVVVN